MKDQKSFIFIAEVQPNFAKQSSAICVMKKYYSNTWQSNTY